MEIKPFGRIMDDAIMLKFLRSFKRDLINHVYKTGQLTRNRSN